MNSPAQSVLTVRSNRSELSFAPGGDVIVGSDVRADLRVAHPLVTRAHLLLRFDQGKWVGVDNNSRNGIFVDGRRVPMLDIRDGQAVNLGAPDGPRIVFSVGRHRGAVGVLPPTSLTVPTVRPPHGYQDRPTDALHATAVPIVQPTATTRAVPMDATQVARPGGGDVSKSPTRVRKVVGPESAQKAAAGGTTSIGRALDNDIVIHDVLASRHHAFLEPTPAGIEIRDASSINGTFVNGLRVGSALLAEGDVVTIGNVDLVFTAGMLARRQDAATSTGGLEVREVGFAINGKDLLQQISMTARPGTLTAIIGGSGAGKSTLSRLVAGYTTPTAGAVTFEGHNIHTAYASLRSRIGMVPQDDVVHRQLTVNQALGYAAELRLPPDTSKADRDQVVAQVLDELGLTAHAQTRVDKLSGGQRKRASVALELLTGPSLLILDEPTSGLDPALDLQVMTMLRQLADAGRVVLVVTHSLTYLDVCDQVLLMAPGGKIAFLGAPGQIGDAMGTSNWAEIFAKVGADPDEANRRFLERQEHALPTRAETPADLGAPSRSSMLHQFSTIARRQIRLIVSDRAYFAFLALLPFILGALSLTVPGNTGFGVADPASETPDEAAQILTLLSIAAVFMGTALTIRDLIGERAIFQREQAVGLSTGAYLSAKVTVFCAFAIIQAAIATGIVLLGKGAPKQPALLLGNASLELFVTVAATCVASAILGLVLSSIARSNEQIMPLLVVSLMLQLVLAGGMVPVTGRLFLDQISWLMPSRWGYAASASTVNLRVLVPIGPKDSHWVHKDSAWLLDMGMLGVLSVIYSAIVWWRIRLRR
ncbi:ATP-binding cassette domain-containing protein [Mycobacterium montefiorense]|uniref:ABC transporter ATP-binding/permease Rv1747 n=1 Tax=Mycobacterium montefiorense TaxID=154654 RepID=A0AA37PNS5_9MYCO|nr:ATP-binding cassette domain-containing protein [Mycobacterium montefiorense]GBG37144.1 ABC transporter ATP-binding/permease Rv1747 [Mycobacterium montefiorense]GKU36246.1 ABC transporter ATP-binding/permease Rv1747 [Mycobacterium montefiorense]GKU42497.1 ABC transporter ATP-binding/permease Rv1747 [Mycobacterium montefiorense]GKU47696.1 ABC transporter ATP-binding/permease Rv1747 [Mycobacterium montefiorense]GKU50949.1 ABC transporter ATP-binding/permease Rv1747 [Mycobacterium montefiorense